MAGSLTAGLKALTSAKIYKPTQGKIARRSTFLGLAVIFLAGGYATYSQNLYGSLKTSVYVGLATFLIGCWISFRAVNIPSFADFLVSVEAEMRKVSWPSKKELYQTTRVVLVAMVLFIALIYFYDVTFSLLFGLLDKMLKGVGIG